MNMKLPFLAAILSVSGMTMACEYDNTPVRTSYDPQLENRGDRGDRGDRYERRVSDERRDMDRNEAADNEAQPPSEQALETSSNGEMHERLGIRQRMICGKIQDTKELSIEGQKDSHVLAKVETRMGNTVVIDLGPRATIPNSVSLQNGSELAAFGTIGRLNGFPLIIAEKVAEVREIPGRQQDAKVQAENQPGGPANIPTKVDPKPSEPPMNNTPEHAR